MQDPSFVSRQTYAAHRYYSNLRPRHGHPLTIVCGGVESMLPEYRVERATFPWYAIEWVIEGRGFLKLHGHLQELEAGSVFAYGPHIPHCIEYAGPAVMRKYYIDVAGDAARHQLDKAGLLAGHALVASRTDELNDLWRWIELEALESTHGESDLCGELFTVLCSKVKQRTGAGRQPRSTTEDAYDLVRCFIEKNYLKYSTIQAVGEALEMSPACISRLYKRCSQTGAYRCLLKLRMTYAANRFCDESATIRDVADELGYSDVFQFSRAFKTAMGIPPSQMRKLRCGDSARIDTEQASATTTPTA